MNNYLLYEIGVEEMPSRFVESTLEQLKSNLSKSLETNRIKFATIDTYATPRRLVLLVKDLADKQTDFEEEAKGPAKKIAVDADGNFTKAAIGFMKGKGLTEEDIYFKEVSGNEYLFATIKEEGKNTDSILLEELQTIVKNVVFPKSMRWGGKNMRFVRPIRWLLALHNDKVLPVNLEGIVASNITVGHRFLGKKTIEVNSVEDYMEKLEENFVILDQNKRKKIIEKQINEVAQSLGGKIEAEDGLLDEVTYLVEYPTAFYGEFAKEYADLPKEVVKTPMQAHQRYFPVVDGSGKLLANFVAVRNGGDYMIENVKKGNEKVLEARLADALFFFDEDRKKTLDDYREKLSTVVFQEKLGTLLDKSNRIHKIAKEYQTSLNIDKEKLVEAAYYAKADLVTNMVFEFDELQGYMGMEYAKLEGKDPLVAQAIFEHYMPRFSGDQVPTSLEASLLSIYDKMDTIAGFFAIGIKPTGSADPFALRRQCLGILTILLEKNIEIDVANLAGIALDQFDMVEFDKEKVIVEIVEFFNERTKYIFKDMGIRYDVVDAVLASDEKNIFDLHERAEAINNWIDRETLTDMLVAFHRVATLAEKAEISNIDENLFADQSEKELYAAFEYVDKNIITFMADKEYTRSLDEFATLKPYIDKFFDSVMVMDDDMLVRNNRLALLKKIYESMLNICDLSKIVYK